MSMNIAQWQTRCMKQMHKYSPHYKLKYATVHQRCAGVIVMSFFTEKPVWHDSSCYWGKSSHGSFYATFSVHSEVFYAFRIFNECIFSIDEMDD